MKKFILFALFALFTLTTVMPAQVTRNGKEFSSVVATKKSDNKTEYTYNHNGSVFPIYLSKNGRAYIIISSKKGEPYKKYLGEEISKTICKELGIEYKERSK